RIDDVSALAKAGAQIRQWIIDTPFQSELENAIRDAFNQFLDQSGVNQRSMRCWINALTTFPH
ncbi:hypothetical protein C7D71_30675, partial [Klebsiella pneumoniae]